MADFHFNVHTDRKIIFEIYYEDGALLEVFLEVRIRKSRAAPQHKKVQKFQLTFLKEKSA